MPKKKLSTKLAEAQQEIRDLKNEIHRVQSGHLPLEHEIQRLTRENERMRVADDELRKLQAGARERLSDAELYALAAFVHTETGSATPARQKLFEQLHVRGILASVKQVSNGA